MEIKASEREGLACWDCCDTVSGGLSRFAVGVWSEKRVGLGEDAEPLLLHNSAGNVGLLAVFDGVGGAGAASAGRSWLGNDRTGAWVGSRVARAATEEWFAHVAHEQVQSAESLRLHLIARLAEMWRSRRRKIVGSMRRELPTTVAALSYQATDDVVHWTALWAGDSRSYLLQSDAGLQQLTTDDAGVTDALALLIDDPPMTNYVCADRPFRINSAQDDASLLAVLVCATDGFFGYLDTPAAFEYVLLNTLSAAESVADWCRRIGDCVTGYTGDDASMALVAFGWSAFADLRAQFANRLAFIESEHWEPVRQSANDRVNYVASRERSWEGYRDSYERRLPTLQPETAS